jgi:hypothetical protein
MRFALPFTIRFWLFAAGTAEADETAKWRRSWGGYRKRAAFPKRTPPAAGCVDTMGEDLLSRRA